MYWTMLLARRLDERAWRLHREGRIAYHVSCIGHEAIQVAAAFALRLGHDWVAPYYRDLALLLALGYTPRDYLLGLMGRRDDPSSGGRQMPAHWSYGPANVVSISSAAGSQTSHAVGLALAAKLRAWDQFVLTTCGEGATSQGEWYEAVNWAAVQRLPVVFLVENNRYAVSTRQGSQMAVGSAAEKADGLGLPGATVDGADLLATHAAVLEAAERARRGEGPTLVEATTYRITPHSSDDDDRSYRPRQEVEAARQRDPLTLARQYLEGQGVLNASVHAQLESKAKEAVEDAVGYAQAAPLPDPEEAAGPLYAEEDGDG